MWTLLDSIAVLWGAEKGRANAGKYNELQAGRRIPGEEQRVQELVHYLRLQAKGIRGDDWLGSDWKPTKPEELAFVAQRKKENDALLIKYGYDAQGNKIRK